MRKAMICVTVMLAIVQLWPMVFGHRITPTIPTIAAEMPKQPSNIVQIQTVAAVAKKAKAKALPATGAANPIGCYQRYQIAYRSCPIDGGGCKMQAADNWDLCEATGFWPD